MLASILIFGFSLLNLLILIVLVDSFLRTGA